MSENLSEAKYSAIKEIQARLNENTENAENRKNSFVGFPLKLLGEAFTQFFSYVIGFNWVIKLSYRVDVPYKSLKLPTIDYVYTFLSSQDNLYGRLIRQRVFKDRLITGFVQAKYQYAINPINFLFVPINYIIRNIGKFLGYAIASIFTIPTYLVIKGYYGLKNKNLNAQYQRALGNITDENLAIGWIGDREKNDVISAKEFASRVELPIFFQSFIQVVKAEHAAFKENLGFKLENYGLRGTFQTYIHERKAILQGLDLRTSEQNTELRDLDITEKFVLEKLFDPKTGLINIEALFREGGRRQELGQVDMAIACFSNVPNSSPFYIEAMDRCAAILRVNERYDESIIYSQKGGDKQSEKIEQALIRSGDDTTFGDIYDLADEKIKRKNSHNTILSELPQSADDGILPLDAEVGSPESKRSLPKRASENSTHGEDTNSSRPNNYGGGKASISLVVIGIIAAPPLMSYGISPENTKNFFENTWEFLKKPTGHSELPIGATIALCVVGAIIIGLILHKQPKSNNNENVVKIDPSLGSAATVSPGNGSYDNIGN